MMDTYRDDLQAAMARAEAAEKALENQEKLIDARIHQFIRRFVNKILLFLVLPVTAICGTICFYLRYPTYEQELTVTEPIMAVCGPGANGGNVRIEGGLPGLGCGGFKDGVPGQILIGDEVANEIHIGHEGSVTILHGRVLFDDKVSLDGDIESTSANSGNGGSALLMGGSGGAGR